MISPLVSILSQLTPILKLKPALGSTQPLIQWVLGLLIPGVRMTTHLSLTSRVRMSGAIPPLPQYICMFVVKILTLGLRLTTHLNLMSKVRMSGAIPPLP
jgi:hypothetical protein